MASVSSPSLSSVATLRNAVTHTYTLSDKHDVKWATLSVVSKAPSADDHPQIFEGHPITGSLELDLPDDHGNSITSVEVRVRYTYPFCVDCNLHRTRSAVGSLPGK